MAVAKATAHLGVKFDERELIRNLMTRVAP